MRSSPGLFEVGLVKLGGHDNGVCVDEGAQAACVIEMHVAVDDIFDGLVGNEFLDLVD